MTILRSIDELKSWRRSLGADRRLGFTPTMGALHDGHLEHLRLLEPVVDRRLCSVFVNPTQFAPGEDLEAYPRDIDRDSRLLEEIGVDALFFPNEPEMYPEGYGTWVTVRGVTDRFEGTHRPEHFRGVATIVCKLINLVEPHVMTLGRKDAQQLRLVEKMVEDLNLDVEILPVPTRRDPDGLAMSSRNRYLSEVERKDALSLSRALQAGAEIYSRTGDLEEAERGIRENLSEPVKLEYGTIVDRRTFDAPESTSSDLLAIIAARVGDTRLIDNWPVTLPDSTFETL